MSAHDPLRNERASLFSLRNLRRRPTRRGPWVNVRRSELDALIEVVDAAFALQGPTLSTWAFIGWEPNPDTKARIDEAFQRLDGAMERFTDD